MTYRRRIRKRCPVCESLFKPVFLAQPVCCVERERPPAPRVPTDYDAEVLRKKAREAQAGRPASRLKPDPDKLMTRWLTKPQKKQERQHDQ